MNHCFLSPRRAVAVRRWARAVKARLCRLHNALRRSAPYLLLRARGSHVTLDPSDNSVTLSPRLFRHLRREAVAGEAACVFLFRVPSRRSFGFTVGSPVADTASCCRIQYNEVHGCVGFEALCPSVGRMYYDLSLPPLRLCRLTVVRQSLPDGRTYFLLVPPRSSRHHSHD